uniref:NADH dehydrogenase subunit 4L n=1 Tax=Surirella sp. TaxID=1526603 RepID=A0A2R4A3L5_9STRA|nr:NADH dehydrogenase subunit 4L [Surirella sp.]
MNNFLYLTTFIYLIGLIGVLVNRKNIIMVLISLEILTLATSLNYSIFSIYLDDIVGHIFVIFLITIAAAESAIGLSLVILMFKLKKTVSFRAVKKIIYKI